LKQRHPVNAAAAMAKHNPTAPPKSAQVAPVQIFAQVPPVRVFAQVAPVRVFKALQPKAALL